MIHKLALSEYWRKVMACIRQCGKCGKIHEIHSKCPKPKSMKQIIDEMKKYTIKFLEDKRKNVDWCRKHSSNMKFGGKHVVC